MARVPSELLNEPGPLLTAGGASVPLTGLARWSSPLTGPPGALGPLPEEVQGEQNPQG